MQRRMASTRSHRQNTKTEEGQELEKGKGAGKKDGLTQKNERRTYLESSLRSHRHTRHENQLKPPSRRVSDADDAEAAVGRQRRSATSKKYTTTYRGLEYSPGSIRGLPPLEHLSILTMPLKKEKERAELSSTGSTLKRAQSMNDRKPKHPQMLLLQRLFRPPAPQQEKRVTCSICLSDDTPLSKSAKLACSHWLCHSCLKQVFTLSISDPQHMPPKCCNSDHIPLKHVEKLFDHKFKSKWNRKFREYSTRNRIYCPSKGCGRWITPERISQGLGSGATASRQYGTCSRCRTKVCCMCHGKRHKGEECPKDEATIKFKELAKKEGWQRCYNCTATVELKEGCNHITCRCRAQFCVLCGSKWKTCGCPWFNYSDAPELPDVLHHAERRDAAHPSLAYQIHVDLMRLQEQEDEALARDLQNSLNFNSSSDDDIVHLFYGV